MSISDDEISLLTLGSVLLRKRWLIGGLAFGGALIGLTLGLLTPRTYMSSATFIPSEPTSDVSGIAAAASQLGLRLNSAESGPWGASAYVELLTSRTLLTPIALDSVRLPELDNRPVPVMELLEVDGDTPGQRVDAAVRSLERVIKASEVRALRGVELRVTTEYPSFSRALASRLVEGINDFNLRTRKTQAGAERVFIEAQSAEAEQALRAAEDRLRVFLQANRTISMSSALAFERDRLEREVSLRRDLHSSWLKNREDARIREVRDTPVISVLEEPQLPVRPQARGTPLKMAFGMLGGLLLGSFIALAQLLLARARETPGRESQEFFELMDRVRPRFLKHGTPREQQVR
jgi:uncharacterized protein involved in exopolysaccharide biosynthesis